MIIIIFCEPRRVAPLNSSSLQLGTMNTDMFPVDVLSEILSQVLIEWPFDDLKLKKPSKNFNPKPKKPSNGHSTFRDLRSVCRMFRYITNDLAAREAFDLGKFKRLERYDYQRRVDHVEFLMTHDEGFREALGRRRNWTLTTVMTPRLLYAIGNHVRSFYQNCRVVNLNMLSIIPFETKLGVGRQLGHAEAPSLHAPTVNEHLMLLSHCERIEVLRLRLASVHDPNPSIRYDTFGDPRKEFIRRVHILHNCGNSNLSRRTTKAGSFPTCCP
jgi:hypothetical protein